ncbi:MULTISPECIES: undecaprenyl-diphosphatase UppP [Sutcliffiella]|uniref:Undecaprenyl-diphosphatase n=1 Tax=Sutcliffiella cohnii TaxID=33932 RepID=A0A223KLU1_9BACI|nr:MULTISPECIES: undecaprenyl-diphosphatase UppP [Sutcliffiella]AST90334.1 undecaprenyl-diphosphatase UppP [Sutcliffiella cohnii]MED4017564.1 undecaprenyl-diphosphatase UppP [Sutcliffiella cohnii]WBL15986.1 undecaprenyl-diphosphatase UppP [Sutcliffiella sp. NC1]
MSILEAIIFGIVQGISEYLPISSTAHIVITQYLLGYNLPGLSFEIFLHLASILAVIIYFRKDIISIITGFFAYFREKTAENKTSFWFAIYIVVATAITGVGGILLEDAFSETLKRPLTISITLTITGLALIYIERLHKDGNRTEKDMTLKDSVIVGIGQTIAVFPGISRSGSTLVAALLSGLNKETAVRYSFLLSVPVILGSSVLAFKDISGGAFAEVGVPALIVAFIVTFIFSWLGIIWLIDFLKRSKLIYFSIYCFILAILVYIFIPASAVANL